MPNLSRILNKNIVWVEVQVRKVTLSTKNTFHLNFCGNNLKEFYTDILELHVWKWGADLETLILEQFQKVLYIIVINFEENVKDQGN